MAQQQIDDVETVVANGPFQRRLIVSDWSRPPACPFFNSASTASGVPVRASSRRSGSLILGSGPAVSVKPAFLSSATIDGQLECRAAPCMSVPSGECTSRLAPRQIIHLRGGVVAAVHRLAQGGRAVFGRWRSRRPRRRSGPPRSAPNPCLESVAHCMSGVLPSFLARLGFAPLSSSKAATSARRSATARNSAVAPSLSRALMSAPAVEGIADFHEPGRADGLGELVFGHDRRGPGRSRRHARRTQSRAAGQPVWCRVVATHRKSGVRSPGASSGVGLAPSSNRSRAAAKFRLVDGPREQGRAVVVAGVDIRVRE